MSDTNPRRSFPAACRWLLAGLVVAVGAATSVAAPVASANEGPPFPLVMDQPAGPYVVSIWADPDIGEARFYVQVESDQLDVDAESLAVDLVVVPADGRLEPVTVAGHRQRLRNRVQFEIKPYFDTQDHWKLAFHVQGRGRSVEPIEATVESTPPGLGPWDLAVYLFPFAFIGAVWATFMIRHQRHAAVARGQCCASPAEGAAR